MLALYNTSIPCPACRLPLLTFNVLPRWPRPSLLLTVFPSARPDFTCCPFFSGVDPSERHEHAPRRSICDVIGGALVRTPTWASKMPAATRSKTKSQNQAQEGHARKHASNKKSAPEIPPGNLFYFRTVVLRRFLTRQKHRFTRAKRGIPEQLISIPKLDGSGLFA